MVCVFFFWCLPLGYCFFRFQGKLKALLRHLQTRDVAKTVKNAESADAGESSGGGT